MKIDAKTFEWSFGEKLTVVLAFFAALCAAYGALMIVGYVGGYIHYRLFWPYHKNYEPEEGSFTAAVAMFFFVFAFMMRGIEDMHGKRVKKEMDERASREKLARENGWPPFGSSH